MEHIMMMEKKQVGEQKEWREAQEISVSIDLVEAAKKQLNFLAAVDRNRYLYQHHVLQRAIYRYNAFWLPLLAKHLENPISEDALVVPLDCEWIWHCHRLNPIRYKQDCQKLYGKILGNRNVISSVEAKSKSTTEEIWNKLYPEEPYELDVNTPFSENVLQKHPQNEKFTTYDLVAAVKRQIPFTYQVSRPNMSNDLFLQEAEARYKGFLHLIRTNTKMGVNQFCVPTYDIDLMWHTHQLYPISYCKDLINLVGWVLQHDDTDSDKTKGSKLDTGHTKTTEQWEETFGTRYWKAGAMYRGSPPTPVITQVSSDIKHEGKKIKESQLFDKPIQQSAREAVEVFLEFVEIKNLPEGHRDNLVVSFSKKQSDKLFDIKRSLSILSEAGEKQVAYFQCEPTGEFLFELQAAQSQNPEALKVIGSCSISLQELISSTSQLSAEKWLSVDLVSGLQTSEPILLRVAVSWTPPTPAPQVFHLDSTQYSLPSLSTMTRNSNLAKTESRVIDDDDMDVFSLQMRNIVDNVRKCTSDLRKEVYLITDSGEKHKVAELLEDNWVINGMYGLFKLQKHSGNNADHLFELIGNKTVKLFRGRRLEFEPKHCGGRRCEQDFISAVEFSTDYPYGKAIALFDLKLRTVKTIDDWIVLPGIILGFIMTQCGDMKTMVSGLSDDTLSTEVVVDDCNREKRSTCSHGGRMDVCGSCDVNNASCGGGKCGGGKCGGMVEKVGSCGSQCGAACGSMVEKVGSCGSKCGGKCGGMVEKASGCGSKCGGKCGGMVEKVGSCGSKCGGACGSMVEKAGGCGSKCGGKCGGMVEKAGGCGSKCGGKCGGMVEKAGGCGSKCGGMVEKVGSCGSKCGGACGSMVGKAGGCGSKCGGKCGGVVEKVGSCGSKCGGACGSMVEKAGGCGSKCGGKCGGMVEEVGGCGSKCGGKCGGMVEKVGSCDSKCGGACGSLVGKAGGCGSKCGGKCGGMVEKVGSCSGKCSGKCGGMVEKVGSCSGKCSGECGGNCWSDFGLEGSAIVGGNDITNFASSFTNHPIVA